VVNSTDIRSHEQYLAKIPREVTKRRAAKYRLDEAVFNTRLPIICNEVFSVVPTEQKEFMHPLEPRSLFDLKNWFGVPNELARSRVSGVRSISGDQQVRDQFTRVNYPELPKKKDFEFGKLEPRQQSVVTQAAKNLLSSYVDEDELKRPEILGVVNYMLERVTKSVPQIFVAPDLIVCPDDKVIFNNIPTVMFNNILIYGSGEIVTKSPLSIDAYQIRHIN